MSHKTSPNQCISVSLSVGQRNLLYRGILSDLRGLDAILQAAERGDCNAADQLSWRYVAELQLIIYSLGWGEAGAEKHAVVKGSRKSFRRILEHLRQMATETEPDPEVRVMCEELLRHPQVDLKPAAIP